MTHLTLGVALVAPKKGIPGRLSSFHVSEELPIIEGNFTSTLYFWTKA